MCKCKRVSNKKSRQLELLQVVPMALKERHDILTGPNQSITFNSYTYCTTRIPYESNGVSVVFEEYRNNNFEAMNDSYEHNEFWRYYIVLDKKNITRQISKSTFSK